MKNVAEKMRGNSAWLSIIPSLVFVGLLIGGCASKPVTLSELPRSKDLYEKTRRELLSGRIVAPGNALSLTYSGDPKVSGIYKVDFDGRIHLPYKVILKVAGLSLSQVNELVTKAYSEFVKGNYSTLTEFKERNVWVEVRGEVKNPGRFLVRMDISLEELVSAAGGFEREQGATSGVARRPDFLRIERPNQNDGIEPGGRSSLWFDLTEYFSNYDTDPDFIWRGGEKVFFQSSAPAGANIRGTWNTVMVMGEVREPKELPVLPNADLLTYISRSGGPSTSADLSRVEIIRRSSDGRITTNLLASRMTNQLKGGDVILVRAVDNSPSFGEKFLSYMLSISTITLSVVTLMLL